MADRCGVEKPRLPDQAANGSIAFHGLHLNIVPHSSLTLRRLNANY